MSIASATASSRLAGIVGPAQVISESPELAAYAIGAKQPTAVVRPGSAEEVAEIVKFASAEKLAVVPCGARTKLPMGMAPRQYDLALDLTRLDRVTAYDPGDLTLAVEPGMRLSKLTGVLAEHKQWLPLAVPYFERTTAGGAIASGVDTPLRQMYGTARDYVLGMEFVTGEGVPAKSGGRVVKNVTGYDMHKLMIGALGTLGVITKINLRTFPVPVSTQVLVASFEDAGRAVQLRHSIAKSALSPMSMEIFSPRAVDILLQADPATFGVPGALPAGALLAKQWVFVAEFSGNEKVLVRCERDFRQMASECGAGKLTALRGEDASAITGRVREFLPMALAAPQATIVKISVLPSRMAQMLAIAEQAAQINSVNDAAMARGLGILYFALLPADRGEEPRRRVMQASEHILTECGKLDGNGSVPWSPPEWTTEWPTQLKDGLKIWGAPRGDFEQMRKVKSIFDPGSVLSPGRFVGAL